MTDAAAFFANKKKKKKAFKFNANKIDSSTVTNTVHVNAPAISTTKTEVSSTTGVLASLTVGNSSSSLAEPALVTANGGDDGALWDDAAMAAKTSRKVMAVSVPPGVTTKELAETKAMALKTYTSSNEQADIVEKLRVEETKAKLAAAREGMEREAQRIKEGKEKKEQEVTSSRFENAAAGMSASSGGGGKWVPTRMRTGGGGAGISTGWGSKMSSQKKVDTEDEDLFPDLATADAIIEKQKQEQPAFKAPTKTPVGGGASWGASSSSAAPATRPKLNLAPATRPKLNLKKKTQQEPSKVEEGSDTGKVEETPTVSSAAEAVKSEAVSPVPTNEEPTLAAAGPSPVVVAAAIAPAPIKPKKKKKKKDISTFKK